MSAALPEFFANPVHPEYLADPFCWFHDGLYYAIGTRKPITQRDRVVPLIKSSDLQHWEELGFVLEVPEEEKGGVCFWAPEVAIQDGIFYMYYQCCPPGRGYHIRVACSETAEGPYVDTGRPLTDLEKNPFAIDAHPFQDEDGTWYLFYATDFLDHDETTFRGTALVVDRLIDMTALAGTPQTVRRAHWPWQRYDRDRNLYGEVADWYTLEGPTVRKRDGRYICFYSGGCYQNDSYGVDYLVADRLTGPWREAGCERGPQVLRTLPGTVIGPGHNSIVTTPDGTDLIVYHAWNREMTARLMCLDRLDWHDGVPSVARFAEAIAQTSAQERTCP